MKSRDGSARSLPAIGKGLDLEQNFLGALLLAFPSVVTLDAGKNGNASRKLCIEQSLDDSFGMFPIWNRAEDEDGLGAGKGMGFIFFCHKLP